MKKSLSCWLFLLLAPALLPAQIAVRARTLYPMTGDLRPIPDAVVLIGPDGKIQQLGPAGGIPIPPDWAIHEASVVLPGLIDARTTAGLSGALNWDRRDQEQLENSHPLQPELRAIDAYNGRDPLVSWLRGFGITTLHTGHAPGALISGQTMVVKTHLPSLVRPEDAVKSFAGVAASLGAASFSQEGNKAPGTRAKSVALLRAELIKAQEYSAKLKRAEPGKTPDRDLHLESLVAVLQGEVPLLITADRHHDIAAALRLKTEFGFRLLLDSAAEAYLLLPEIKAAGVPILVHPVMARAEGDRENLTFTLPAKLQEAGIPFAFQSGHEAYVPKTRVVLFEAAMASAHGLPREQALAALTIRSAEILGLAERLGSLAPGKDADLALFDGDPLETTTHCTGVMIQGKSIQTQLR